MFLVVENEGIRAGLPQFLRKVCIANQKIKDNDLVLYSVLFNFGHLSSISICSKLIAVLTAKSEIRSIPVCVFRICITTATKRLECRIRLEGLVEIVQYKL